YMTDEPRSLSYICTSRPLAWSVNSAARWESAPAALERAGARPVSGSGIGEDSSRHLDPSELSRVPLQSRRAGKLVLHCTSRLTGRSPGQESPQRDWIVAPALERAGALAVPYSRAARPAHSSHSLTGRRC